MAILVLPDEIQRVVEAEVLEGGYAHAAEYVTQLVRQDRAAMDLESVQKLGNTPQELMCEGNMDHGFC